MTENEALKQHIKECRSRQLNILHFLKSDKNADIEGCKENVSILKTVIKALEEIQQYREIGTIEEFKALKEKNETLKALYEDARKEGNNLIIKARTEARTEAITEFAERVKEVYPFTILELEQLDEIAEQMKGGADNGKDSN